ncbi:MAG: type IV secretion system DNA-binding domain-containing protein [Actinobacteria bacterium]|nr:type IV secretion system DNA-binding domain-containing protein [Actinomycetota bacterium]
MNLKLGITYNDADEIVGFYLPEEDRSTHIYVLGSSGVGKSKGLATWILGDIMNGNGCGVIDPHGDLINDIIGNLDDFRNVTLVEMTDPANIIGFNPLEVQPGIDPYTQMLELVEVFRKIWNLSEDKTPRLIEILRNSVLTLIEAGGTMLDIEPLLTNEKFRKEKMKYVSYEGVDIFWHDRFERWSEADRISNVESTLNKVSSFTSDPRIRLMLSAKKSTIDFRQIMDKEQTVLINLAKGVLRTNSFLLGALFVAKIQMAAMSRVDLPPSERKPFYLYVDEFQNYATLSFAEIMSEARKYGLSLILAHQSLVQLDQQLRDIILGNAKNFVIYRCDRQDAELIIKYMREYDPWDVKDRIDLSNTYFTKDEQREQGISELMDLDTQVAILKTKGKNSMMFRTFDLDESSHLVENLATLRLRNKDSGKTLSLATLDEDVTFSSSIAIEEPEEPYKYVD